MISRLILTTMLFTAPATAFAASPGEWFFDPSASVGFNTIQGTHFRLGLDGGFYLDENIRVGVGAYYAAGEKLQHDREMGAGPFVGYVLPLTNFLVFSAREDIDYVDARYPIRVMTPNGEEDSYSKETGVISATSAGLHIFFTPNFLVSGGYRYVLSLSNNALDDGRSATFLGFAFGI